MITPEGYYPLSALIADALGDSLYSEAEKYLLESTKSLLSLATSRRDDLVLRWVFDFCGQRLFVCNHRGNVYQIDAKLLSRNLYFVDITSKIMAGEDSIRVPAQLQKDFHFCEPMNEIEVDEFNLLVDEFYNAGSGELQNTASLKIENKIKEKIQENGFTRPPIFFETLTGKIDLRLFDFLHETGSADGISIDVYDMVRTAKELKKIEGWTLAIPYSLISDAWSEFCEDRALKHKKEMDSILRRNDSNLGRPRKREKAAEAFFQLYPDGLRRDSWVRAAHLVSKIMDESISVDTLKRGLDEKADQ